MLKIDDVIFKAISYIGSTTNETWIFATKPILENGQYVMPRDYENKSIMNAERINGCILPIMLGDPHDYKYFNVDTTGIYKVTIEKVEEVDLEITTYKSNKNETNDERILRLLGSEYEIRRTNTDEAIGMLESDVVHSKASDDVIILVKK